MRLKCLRGFIFITATAILAACSQGDDPTANKATLSGTAAKGPINNGTVKVYALDATGNKGTVLGETITAADGSYALAIDPYAGFVLVEIRGGTYTDEATGATRSNTALRAAAAVAGDSVMTVTPLTEIAVQTAGALTPANIEAANKLVAAMVGGIDIIATKPADALVLPTATASSQSLDYALALATLSQLLNDQPAFGALDGLLSAISGDLADRQLDTVGPGMSSALAHFLASANNLTGLTAGTTSLDQAFDDAALRPINTTAIPATVDIMMSIANYLTSDDDHTVYMQKFTVFAFDQQNGNPVANMNVFLNLRPTNYYHGYWAKNAQGQWESRYTNWPAATCANSFMEANEDTNMNTILDPGEDVGPMGQPDGFLTPGRSAAGAVPAFVTTDASGLATFEVTYPRQYAVWIEDRLTVATNKQMTENRHDREWVLNYATVDLSENFAANEGSPFGSVPECTVP